MELIIFLGTLVALVAICAVLDHARRSKEQAAAPDLAQAAYDKIAAELKREQERSAMYAARLIYAFGQKALTMEALEYAEMVLRIRVQIQQANLMNQKPASEKTQ